jgi:hypothetical protein
MIRSSRPIQISSRVASDLCKIYGFLVTQRRDTHNPQCGAADDVLPRTSGTLLVGLSVVPRKLLASARRSAMLSNLVASDSHLWQRAKLCVPLSRSTLNQADSQPAFNLVMTNVWSHAPRRAYPNSLLCISIKAAGLNYSVVHYKKS